MIPLEIGPAMGPYGSLPFSLSSLAIVDLWTLIALPM